MSGKIVTHDFDSTIMLSPFTHWWWSKWFLYPNKLIEKRSVRVIVTGRPRKEAWLVKFYLWLYGFNGVLATFRESKEYRGLEEVISSKISRLKLLGASCHYDDCPLTCQRIKEELGIDVIQVTREGLIKL